MAMKIFLSVGRASSQAQEDFVRAIEGYLQANGFIPQTVGRTYFSSLQPLQTVDTLMRECCGTIIVAFERVFLVEAIERRGSAQQTALNDVKLPTVWNQIEAAMAYMRGHPLLVIVERGIKSEGLLEKGYDWYVQWVELDQAAFTTAEFVGVFADWRRRAEQYYAANVQSQQAIQATNSPLISSGQKRKRLRENIGAFLSESELSTLCFDMNIDYENLPGEGKEAKAREVIAYCERSGRLEELRENCREIRPNVQW
jgi:hypothetical protein